LSISPLILINNRVGTGRDQLPHVFMYVQGCIQKLPDWPPGVSQSSEFCRHNLLFCFSTSVCCRRCLFRYRLSPETFGYTLVCVYVCMCVRACVVLRGNMSFRSDEQTL